MKTIFRTIIIVVILVCGIDTIGQTNFTYKEDFNKILTKTKDSSDTLFYDKLLSRFSVNDTTLSDFEVLALLIGFTGKEQYKPYRDVYVEREIYKLNDEKNYSEGLELAQNFLSTHPLSVKALIEISYSFSKLHKVDSSAFYAYQAKKIFEAMYYSGDGKTIETPTFALGPADGQDYIYKFVGAQIGAMGSNYDNDLQFLDILEAKFEDGRSMYLYFIIAHAFSAMDSGGSPKESKKKKNK